MALLISRPWYVKDVEFDTGKRLLTIAIDFKMGSRFPYEGTEGLHPVHDTRPSATAISTSSSTNAISKCARQGSSFPMAAWF